MYLNVLRYQESSSQKECQGTGSPVRMKHKVGDYACETCDKAFSYKKNYDEHCLTHDIEQITAMSTEGTNTDKSTAKEHLKTHACNQCDKSYKRKDHLKRHELIHTGERPHICLVCMKAFVRKDKLTRHENIHFKDKRLQFSCPDCKKMFLRKDSLDKHRRNTHGDYMKTDTPRTMPMANATLKQSDGTDNNTGEVDLLMSVETGVGNASGPDNFSASSTSEQNTHGDYMKTDTPRTMPMAKATIKQSDVTDNNTGVVDLLMSVETEVGNASGPDKFSASSTSEQNNFTNS